MSISPFLSSAEVPHAPRLAANGWRMLCCPMHMAMMLPMGMGAAVATPPSSEPPPSFLDGTAAQATEWASRGDEHTKDLFDVAEPGRWVVLRGATVWPMTGDYGLANHDILVRDGVIRAVQATGAALPEGARVIEAQGQHVIPGLADNHCHPPLLHVSAMWAGMFGPQVTAEDLQLPYDLHMFLYLSGGITRIQAMAGSAEDLTLRDSIRQGRLRGPAMRVASPVIDGYPLVWGSGISSGIGDPEGGRANAASTSPSPTPGSVWMPTTSCSTSARPWASRSPATSRPRCRWNTPCARASAAWHMSSSTSTTNQNPNAATWT
jgi:hypothetical protein